MSGSSHDGCIQVASQHRQRNLVLRSFKRLRRPLRNVFEHGRQTNQINRDMNEGQLHEGSQRRCWRHLLVSPAPETAACARVSRRFPQGGGFYLQETVTRMYSEKRAVFRTCQTRDPTGLVMAAASRNIKKNAVAFLAFLNQKHRFTWRKGLGVQVALTREQRRWP